MRIRVLSSLAVALVILAGLEGPAAQTARLTTAQIEAAVAAGLRAKGREQGLQIRDTFATLMLGFDGLDPASKGSETGFSLTVYTPTTWIRQQASQAAREYRGFAASDVSDEMTEPVLRIIVLPSTPTQNTEAAARWASSVQHVVLRDKSRKVVLQPLGKESFTQGLSTTAPYQGVEARFALADLREVRGAGGTGEFCITVIGSKLGADKDFEIKGKHFERLP